jgi:hypothetical protein
MRDAIQPLSSAAQLPYKKYPVIHIPDNKLPVIQERTEEIADNSPGNSEEHLTGKLGEFAVAEHLGIEPLKEKLDLNIYTDGGDGGFDLKYDGKKIEVKTAGAQSENPGLPIDHKEPLIADWYILTRRMGKTDIQLIGCAPRVTVEAFLDKNDTGKYSLLDQEYLFPMR